MSSGRSLLQRLEFPGASDSRDLASDSRDVLEAIQHHLQILLNTRRGGASAAPDFGISDLADFLRGYEAAFDLKQEIQETIDRYEPRLREVRVVFIEREDDPFRLHFNIEATVRGPDGDSPTVFRSVVDSSGSIRVSGS